MMGKEGIYQREFIPPGRQAEQRRSWLISTLIGSALTGPRVCVREACVARFHCFRRFGLFYRCAFGCPQHRSGCTAAWTATSSSSTWPGSPIRWSSLPSPRDSPRFWLRRLSVRQKHSAEKTEKSVTQFPERCLKKKK